MVTDDAFQSRTICKPMVSHFKKCVFFDCMHGWLTEETPSRDNIQKKVFNNTPKKAVLAPKKKPQIYTGGTN